MNIPLELPELVVALTRLAEALMDLLLELFQVPLCLEHILKALPKWLAVHVLEYQCVDLHCVLAEKSISHACRHAEESFVGFCPQLDVQPGHALLHVCQHLVIFGAFFGLWH